MKKMIIKEMIHRNTAKWTPERSHKVVHASDLTRQDGEFCPREFLLLDIHNMKPDDRFIGTSLRMTFDTGELLAKQVTDVYLRKFAVGNWECVMCETIFEFCKLPSECGCGSNKFEYKEVNFISQTYGFSSSLDIIVDTGEPKLRTVELKTMKADQFKTLIAPLAEHKLRTNLYMTAIKDSLHPQRKQINTEEASILYIMKGYGIKDPWISDMGIKDDKFSPFKEYTIKRDEGPTQYYLDKGAELKIYRDEFEKTGKVKSHPPRIEACDSIDCGRARDCPVKKQCYAKGMK